MVNSTPRSTKYSLMLELNHPTIVGWLACVRCNAIFGNSRLTRPVYEIILSKPASKREPSLYGYLGDKRRAVMLLAIDP